MQKMARFFYAIVFISVNLIINRAKAQNPHKSFDEILSSNGWGSVHVYEPEKKITSFYPHIYKQWSPEKPITPNLAYDAYFGIRAPATWLSESSINSISYEDYTNIIHIEQTINIDSNNVDVVTKVFAPFDLKAPGFVMILEVNGPTSPFASFALLNFRVGGGSDSKENESIYPYLNGYVEKGPSGYFMYYRPIELPSGVMAGASGSSSPYQVMKDGGDFTTLDSTQTGTDLALGFQYNVATGLRNNDVKYFGIIVAGGEIERFNKIISEVENYAKDETNSFNLLEKSRNDWQEFQSRALLPTTISDKEERALRSGLVVLRMAQVLEDTEPYDQEPCGGPYGQILAALPKARPAQGEGIWNIAWVRDGAYAIVALAKTGYLDEAKKALEFMMRAQAGEYSQALGMDYGISVCRYYGCGREESDWDQNGPNIEFDDFGLFLWAFSEVAKRDHDWALQYIDFVRDKVADVLIALLEDSTFLISPDSSIWERHWNGNEKHFTYTNAVAVKGLCEISSLFKSLSIGEDRIITYQKAVSKILKGIRVNLVDENNVLLGNLEEPNGQNLDMAAIEVFNFGLISFQDPVTNSTIETWKTRFYDGNGTNGGFYRNDDGDWYDEQEWTFIDLRSYITLNKLNDPLGENILSWVIEQTLQNHGLMGELYCRGTDNCDTRGDYKGSVPMVGFGPGALLLALFSRNEQPPILCADATDADPGIGLPPQSNGTQDTSELTHEQNETQGGCSCKVGSQGNDSFVLIYLIIIIGLFLCRNQLFKLD